MHMIGKQAHLLHLLICRCFSSPLQDLETNHESRRPDHDKSPLQDLETDHELRRPDHDNLQGPSTSPCSKGSNLAIDRQARACHML